MSFIGSVVSAIVSVIVYIVEAVVQVVEMIIHLIMILLGWDGGSTQIIEYYEVQNVPLFDDVDNKNPLLQSVIQSILENKDIASNLIYNVVFRSLKGDIKAFMGFIENGNYFESFPTVESYILVIDYGELTTALNTLNGVPCTPEGSFLRALSNPDWIKYWLQENKEYNVGTNTIGVNYSTTSEDTVTITPSTNNFDIDIIGEIATADAGTINAVAIDADTVTVTPSTNHFDIAITSDIASSDTVKAIASNIGSQPLQVNLSTIVYNSGADTYTVQVYDAAGLVLTLPYTVPSKPTQLHYVSTYYRDSAPSRQYLFIYRVGTGTYTDLDTVEEPIDQSGSTIETLPAVPLRISNANYTTFGATKAAQIEDLLLILNLNAEEMIDAVMNDPGAEPGDIDNVYVNFGVRMWDTSQQGMSYLYTMFENLYPSQGVTQGTYNNSPAGDDKPQNNILTTTEDNKYAFQFSYITYEHTSLAAINADSGSVENGIYYSDMSRFGPDNLLKYRYFVSSGKGTYNVGYKADNLAEVAAFLAGSGVANPGTTTAEATNWLQVTERMVYNNPTPNLLEADDSASDLIYLTPDLVYENNGSGTLRLIEAASEATTVGQSITYYCCKVSGLDAYTVIAPIAALKVIDGASGHFRMVKFNLGNKGDLMVPFIHTFVKDLSNQRISQLFLAGAHVSIYIAHYEVIHHAGMSFLEALVMLIIIIVVIYFAWQAGVEMIASLKAAWAAAATMTISEIITLVLTKLATYAFKFVVQMIVQKIIVEIAGDNEQLAAILTLLAAIAITAWDVEATFSMEGGFQITDGTGLDFKSFAEFTPLDFGKLAVKVLDGINKVLLVETRDKAKELEERDKRLEQQYLLKDAKLREIEEDIFRMPKIDNLVSILGQRRKGPVLPIYASSYFDIADKRFDIHTGMQTAFSETIEAKVSYKYV
jgi:hypothetical protein